MPAWIYSLHFPCPGVGPSARNLSDTAAAHSKLCPALSEAFCYTDVKQHAMAPVTHSVCPASPTRCRLQGTDPALTPQYPSSLRNTMCWQRRLSESHLPSCDSLPPSAAAWLAMIVWFFFSQNRKHAIPRRLGSVMLSAQNCVSEASPESSIRVSRWAHPVTDKQPGTNSRLCSDFRDHKASDSSIYH